MRDIRPHGQVSLAFLIASTITLGMLVLTIILVGQSFSGLEQAKVAAAESTAKQLAMNVDAHIDSITQPPATALAILRHDPIAYATTVEERLKRLPAFADILSSNDVVSAVYAGYQSGDFFLLRKIRSSGSLQFQDAPDNSHYLLQSLTRRGEHFVGQWRFYDKQLELLEQRELNNYQYDPRERPWYQAAFATPNLQLSEPYLFFTTGETGLTLSRRASQPTSTVLGMDVTVTDLGTQLARLKQTPTTRIAILNEKNQPLASTHQLSDPGPITLVANTEKNTIGITRFSFANRSWVGITEPLKAMPDEKLSINIAIPEDELLADVWAALARQTLVACFIALALLIIGWLLGRKVGQPLEQLTNRIGQLSQFRFDLPLRADSRIREASELGVALDDMAQTIRSFQNISTTLNRGQDLNQLLQDILGLIVGMVGQKHGAIYLYNRSEQSLNLAAHGNLDLSGCIEDIHPDISDWELIQTLHRFAPTHSVFSVLRNRDHKLIGVLIIVMEHGDAGKLGDDVINFVNEIAGSAAVAIETRGLIESQRALLDGIIQLVANAIDAKSPYTGGHCKRVPLLAQMLVEHAESSDDGPFSSFQMTADEHYEFQIAAWLHDCGKITSPEYVVDKAVKLETLHNRIHDIRTRFEVLHRDAEIDYLNALLAGENAQAAETRRDAVQAALQEDFAFIAWANQGRESMSDEDIQRIETISQRTWLRHFSDRLGLSGDEEQALTGIEESPLPTRENLLADKAEHIRVWGELTPPVQKDDPRNRWGFDMELPEYQYNRGELHSLTVRSGTLTYEERFKINEHIVQTICMLDTLPLPDHLAKVPRLAGTHHERMDGQGYPCKLTAEDMSIPEKIMAVADVFEALTAVDRPYKKGKTLTESLTIMARMVDSGHIDRDVFNLFIHSRTYLSYAEQYLQPEQIDAVDESLFMKPS